MMTSYWLLMVGNRNDFMKSDLIANNNSKLETLVKPYQIYALKHAVSTPNY